MKDEDDEVDAREGACSMETAMARVESTTMAGVGGEDGAAVEVVE